MTETNNILNSLYRKNSKRCMKRSAQGNVDQVCLSCADPKNSVRVGVVGFQSPEILLSLQPILEKQLESRVIRASFS